MCGISGCLSLADRRPLELDASLAAQRHRGPDGERIWHDRHCALGQTRLAIIDLSTAAQGPLSNESGSIWVTYNGEIYNFRELRGELERDGHVFGSGTDTEIIVHAYEKWGVDCVQRFRGMFAFGLWDRRAKRLLLARDRAGKKPLVYAKANGKLLFASEIQGLLAFPDVSRDIDLVSLDAYLSWGYVPAPRSGFEQIKKLGPGHRMVVEVADGSYRERIEPYWELPYLPKWDVDEQQAGATLRDKLSESVRLRMISDVPLGAFLSGGIDSSIVVGLMAQLSPAPVKTFSIGFDEASFNELPHARRIAQKWGTDHHEDVVRPDALEVIPLLARHYGEPYADSSAIPTFYVAQRTSAEVTVALNGDGGDENFAGYQRYWANRVAQRLAAVPVSPTLAVKVRSAVGNLGDGRQLLPRLARFLGAAFQPMPRRYGLWHAYFTEDAKDALYSEELWSRVLRSGERWFESLFDGTDALDPADAAMSVDVRSYLPYDLLVKVDIASMANSLESRSPFLDHEVMEFCARLPAGYKLRGRTSKHLLKKEFSDLLPRENVARPKQGFGVPVGEWFRGPLKDLLHDCLLSQIALNRGYFQPAALRSLVDAHVEGRQDHSSRLWNLVMLEMWHRVLVDEPVRT